MNITPESVKKLLDAATQGEWKRDGFFGDVIDSDGRNVCCADEHNGALIATTPQIAQAYIDKSAENERLKKYLAETIGWFSYETEYDGRMMELMNCCEGQDGEHEANCLLPEMRQALQESKP